MLTLLLLIHATATLFMTGLIWFVQIVHYPLLGVAGGGEFRTYEDRHCRLTGYVVLPPMLIELATAMALVFMPLSRPAMWTALAGLVLLAAIWASTFLLQVPQHRRLCRGFDAAAHRRLVRSNWVRTAAWTTRAAIAMVLLHAGLS